MSTWQFTKSVDGTKNFGIIYIIVIVKKDMMLSEEAVLC